VERWWGVDVGLQLYSCRVLASVIVGVLLAMGIPFLFVGVNDILEA
jgi:hypothetical protein